MTCGIGRHTRRRMEDTEFQPHQITHSNQQCLWFDSLLLTIASNLNWVCPYVQGDKEGGLALIPDVQHMTISISHSSSHSNWSGESDQTSGLLLRLPGKKLALSKQIGTWKIWNCYIHPPMQEKTYLRAGELRWGKAKRHREAGIWFHFWTPGFSPSWSHLGFSGTWGSIFFFA